MEKEQIIPELERITIGRAVDNRVVLTPTNIGRHHAVITITAPNVYLLEDLDSKHGTYVNSERIHRKLISGEDKISFATNHLVVCEILEMAKVIKPTNKASKGDDYTEEFAAMQTIYEQYQLFKTEEINIGHVIRRTQEHLRLGGALAAPTITGLALLFATGPLAPVIGVIGGCGLGMLIPAIGSKFLNEDEKLQQPRLYFANNWKCPKCGDKASLYNKSWETLAKQKKCTKCNAIWVK
jgi:hypothetical protein